MIFNKFLEQLFFPVNVNCNYCGKEQIYKYGICKECYDQLKKPEGDRCEICMDRINTEGLCAACFKKKPAYKKLFCGFIYHGPLKKMIIRFKASNKRYMKYPFSDIALDVIPKEIFDKLTLITAVPSSAHRLWDRGYNQARLVAEELSQKTGVPYKDTLIRLKDTKTSKLNKEERLKSIKDQYYFACSVLGETVLLIDDVCTTGSTLRECAKMLKKAGAEEIYCFTVARTELKD